MKESLSLISRIDSQSAATNALIISSVLAVYGVGSVILSSELFIATQKVNQNSNPLLYIVYGNNVSIVITFIIAAQPEACLRVVCCPRGFFGYVDWSL